MAPTEEYDVLIIDAGIAGLNAAYRVQTQLPKARYVVLEARGDIGGTWSFWKYPGLRSDSAISIYSFEWLRYDQQTSLASGGEIVAYMRKAESFAHRKSCLNTKRVMSVEWKSEEQRWTVTVNADGLVKAFRTPRLLNFMGYYKYDAPLPAVIPCIEKSEGEVVHAQLWREETDWTDKRVIIIGSGSTAITLLPKLAEKAKHLAMLQQSPSYVLAVEAEPPLDKKLKRFLPRRLATWLIWWIGVWGEYMLLQTVKKKSSQLREDLMNAMRAQLPLRIDVEKHFNPSYLPAQERVCVCPDGDFFRAFHRDSVDVVTDKIETVLPTGLKTIDGTFIEAGMIVLATGLEVQLWGGLDPVVDGKPVRVSERYVWRSCMLEGIPNAGFATGYISGTYTPGADIGTRSFIKVIQQCQKKRASSAMPTIDASLHREKLPRKRMLKNGSTYMNAGEDRLPLSADVGPWYKATSCLSDASRTWFSNITESIKFVFLEDIETSLK
ncbi:hypothetical protein Daus18300_005587 [Diaporthe australafricana]|uniref:Monooxygenase n=1 Tax=Diaporthe australafricana TaxID=127596 RepID=A0ABR3X0S9_9PEZI